MSNREKFERLTNKLINKNTEKMPEVLGDNVYSSKCPICDKEMTGTKEEIKFQFLVHYISHLELNLK